MIRFPSVQSNANAAYRRAIDASRDVQSPSVILSTSLCRSAGPANVLSLSRHVPSHSGSATRSVAQNEARKRRANERHVVGCCDELGGSPPLEPPKLQVSVPLADHHDNTLLR